MDSGSGSEEAIDIATEGVCVQRTAELKEVARRCDLSIQLLA